MFRFPQRRWDGGSNHLSCTVSASRWLLSSSAVNLLLYLCCLVCLAVPSWLQQNVLPLHATYFLDKGIPLVNSTKMKYSNGPDQQYLRTSTRKYPLHQPPEEVRPTQTAGGYYCRQRRIHVPARRATGHTTKLSKQVKWSPTNHISLPLSLLRLLRPSAAQAARDISCCCKSGPQARRRQLVFPSSPNSPQLSPAPDWWRCRSAIGQPPRVFAHFA
jgi:hypothetical protein